MALLRWSPKLQVTEHWVEEVKVLLQPVPLSLSQPPCLLQFQAQKPLAQCHWLLVKVNRFPWRLTANQLLTTNQLPVVR